MSLKLKATGLALIAAFVTSAILIVAMTNTATNGTAVAETGGHFYTNDTSGHTTLKGEDKAGSTLTFTDEHYASAKVKCKKDTTYEGTITAQTVTEITLTPKFQECEALGFPAHIDMNGCDFVFTIGKTFNQDNTTHIKCPVGKDVQITATGPAGTCTVTIRPQTSEGSGYYTPTEEGEAEITVKPTLRELHAEYIGGVFKCGVAAGTTTTKGKLDGRIALKAFTTAGEQKGITATGPEDG
jgi:hypothetical protein